MRMIDYLRFFTMTVLTLFCGMLTACAIIGDQWILACVFLAFGVMTTYMWTKIPLSGGDDEKGEGGSYA